MTICKVNSIEVSPGNSMIKEGMQQLSQAAHDTYKLIGNFNGNSELNGQGYSAIENYCSQYIYPILDGIIVVADLMTSASDSHMNGLFNCGGISQGEGYVDASTNVLEDLQRRIDSLRRSLATYQALADQSLRDYEAYVAAYGYCPYTPNDYGAQIASCYNAINSLQKELDKKTLLHNYEASSSSKFDYMEQAFNKLLSLTNALVASKPYVFMPTGPMDKMDIKVNFAIAQEQINQLNSDLAVLKEETSWFNYQEFKDFWGPLVFAEPVVPGLTLTYLAHLMNRDSGHYRRCAVTVFQRICQMYAVDPLTMDMEGPSSNKPTGQNKIYDIFNETIYNKSHAKNYWNLNEQAKANGNTHFNSGSIPKPGCIAVWADGRSTNPNYEPSGHIVFVEDVKEIYDKSGNFVNYEVRITEASGNEKIGPVAGNNYIRETVFTYSPNSEINDFENNCKGFSGFVYLNEVVDSTANTVTTYNYNGTVANITDYS